MDTASASIRTPSRYFPDAVWQRKTPAESGIDGARLQAAIDHAIAARGEEPARPRGQSLPDLRPRAFRLRDRSDQGAWRPDRPRRAQGLHRRGMGRACPRRHDPQHHQEHALDGGRARARPRPHPERRRYGARVRGADPALQPVTGRQQVGPHGRLGSAVSLRDAPQPHDHVEPHAAPGERLGRHAVGEARLGRPSERECRRVGQAAPQQAGHGLPGTTTCAPTRSRSRR